MNLFRTFNDFVLVDIDDKLSSKGICVKSGDVLLFTEGFVISAPGDLFLIPNNAIILRDGEWKRKGVFVEKVAVEQTAGVMFRQQEFFRVINSHGEYDDGEFVVVRPYAAQVMSVGEGEDVFFVGVNDIILVKNEDGLRAGEAFTLLDPTKDMEFYRCKNRKQALEGVHGDVRYYFKHLYGTLNLNGDEVLIVERNSIYGEQKACKTKTN